MFTLINPNKPRSSRDQIKLKGVRNDILILSDNSYRLVLQVTPINFELKSEAEQDAIIDNYQKFLNALPCSIQIIFRTRAMDLDSYLSSFTNQANNDQTKNYSYFVKQLVADNKILSRSFYLVIPLTSQDPIDIDNANQQLKVFEDIVRKGLDQVGIKSRRLSGLEILDLFYSFYSPEQAKTQSISEQTLKLINQAYI